MPVPDARTRSKISLNPSKVLSTSIPSRLLPNLLLSNTLFVASLLAGKEWILDYEVEDYRVLGIASLLLFVQQGCVFITLSRFSPIRAIIFTQFSTIWVDALVNFADSQKMNAIFCALILGVVSDAAFSSTGIWSVLPGYVAIVGHGVTSTVLDHTYAVLSPGLGTTFTIAATNLGASLFALPFYIFRTVILGFPTTPVLPLFSLALIPFMAYSLLFLSPTTVRSLKNAAPNSRHIAMSFPFSFGCSVILGSLAFSQIPSWTDVTIGLALYFGMYPQNDDNTPVTPRAPTSRLIRSYLKTILSNPESRKIFYFLLLNLCYMLVQMLYGIWTNSLGLISDAIHMAFDCMAIGVGLFASVMATWEPNETFTYGYGRIETLSGFANGIFLILISIFIVFEAVQRILDPPEMDTSQLLLVSSLGLAVNLFGMFAMGGHHHHHTLIHTRSMITPTVPMNMVPHMSTNLGCTRQANQTQLSCFTHDEHYETHHATAHAPNLHDHSHAPSHEGHSHNMRGVFLHVMADTLGSVGVIISTLLIQFYGWTGFDPIASLFIAILIAASVIPLVLDTGKVLALDIDERATDIHKALAELSTIEGLSSYSYPRFWPKDANSLIGSIHIQLAPSAATFDPHGPHSAVRTTYARLDRVIEKVDSMLRNRVEGLEELTIQIEEGQC
ncbi:cation efflux protein [Lentinula edodes]|uniref:Cation efflux protein n=1 Tax=Lentinula edodes TaxID=5353 RepID=A0A1Q3EQZ1_LENED|nr:cation efflux protein [Lentinula edodes]